MGFETVSPLHLLPKYLDIPFDVFFVRYLPEGKFDWMGINWNRLKFWSAANVAGDTRQVVEVDNGLPTYNGTAERKHWDKIRFAFRSGNRNYFCFDHDINIPYERMHAAIDIYRELDAAINPIYLDSHCKAVDSVLESEKIKINKKLIEIGILNARLKERKELAISIQIQVKLATVKYFDEVENPFDYQHLYNKNKIEHWAKNADVPTFFLNLPQSQYLSTGEELQKSLTTFLQGETLMNLKMLEHHITLLALEDSSPDTMKILALQKEWESTFLDWSNNHSTLTT